MCSQHWCACTIKSRVPAYVIQRICCTKASVVVQLDGGTHEQKAAANHGMGGDAAAQHASAAEGSNHGQSGGGTDQAHAEDNKHELTTHDKKDLANAEAAGYHTEQAVKENIEVSKVEIEGVYMLGAERATERAERPERQAVRENIMRGVQISMHPVATSLLDNLKYHAV